MKFNYKITAILSLLSIFIAIGSYFYGFSEASKQFAHNDNQPNTSPDKSSASPGVSLEGEESLTDAERAVIAQFRKYGGDDFMQAFVEETAPFMEHFAEAVFKESAEPFPSSSALNAILAELEAGNYDRDKIREWIHLVRGDDIPSAYRALNQFARQDPNFRSMASTLIQNLAIEDVKAALDFVSSIEAKSDRSSSTGVVLHEWSKQDPYAALEWLADNNQLNPSLVSNATYSIFKELAKIDVSEATNLLIGIEDQSTRQRATVGVLISLIGNESTDQQTVLDFITSQPSDFQGSLLSSTLRNRKFRNFESGISIAQSLEETHPRLAQQAYHNIGYQNSRNYPQQTADWALTLENEKTQERILGDAVRHWIQFDLEEAGEWLSKTSSSPIYDTAYQNYVSEATKSDPANAMTWAEAISDNRKRNLSVTRVANSWARVDYNAARAHVQSTEALGEPARKKLLNELKRKYGK